MSEFAAHVMNAALASGIIALLMAFVRRLAGQTAALLAGVIFACSASLPLGLSWISADQDLLCALFAMAALYAQLRDKALLSALFVAASLLSKETGAAVLPAVVAIAIVRHRGSPQRVIRSMAAQVTVIIAWGAIHPWTRSLLSGTALRADRGEMYLKNGATFFPALGQGLAITLNMPWITPAAEWPRYLILPAALVSVILVALLYLKGRRSNGGGEKGESPGLAVVTGLLVMAGSITLTSFLLGRWSPHYVILPVLGLSMVGGPILVRQNLVVRSAIVLVFLWLGIGLRGNPIIPIIATEPNLLETAGALSKVERGFKALHPSFPSGSNVFVSVQLRQSGGLYQHLFRFQPLRVWYRNPEIWVLDPNRRRKEEPNEFLFWIDPDLQVYEIRLSDLFPHGPTNQISLPRYQKTLRGYAMGLAGAGDVNRAVYILANLPETSKEVGAFDRRTAIALLFSAGRDREAMQVASELPKFSPTEATQAVIALLAEPVTGLDLDQAAMKAFGLDPFDISTLRAIMRGLEAGGYKIAAGRFASRIQTLSPGDPESAAVLHRVAIKPHQWITVPVPYDIPQ